MANRLRFAPSPTGYLHIGGARTALFNWLYARHTGGKFLLRIEDTDLERSTEASTRAIIEGLEWLGLAWDEDIVIQTSRRDEHLRLADELIRAGHAYKCFCTAEELDRMREEAVAEGRKPMYDRRWRDRDDHPDGQPFVIRFKMPLDGATTVDDMVLGPITVAHEELDDFVLVRSDGTPTYNFVVVCDDAFMGMTHVCRGQDHMTNTFRQVQLYRAFGYPEPRFAHLPLVDGLSKRKGSASVQFYRDAGYLTEAVVNYIARLGWSHGDQEIFSMDELVENFDLVDVNRGSGKYDEVKMLWVNEQWMKRVPADELARRLVPFLVARGVDTSDADPRVGKLAAALQERSKTLVEMADGALFAWKAPTAWDDKATARFLKNAIRPAFERLIDRFEALTDFSSASVEATVQEVIAETGVALGKLAQPVRIALTGGSVSPPIFDTISVVGRDEATRRMRAVLPLFAD